MTDVEKHPPKDQLIAFGLGKLDPDEAEQVAEHLYDCPDCSDTIVDLQDDTFVSLVRNSPAPPPVDEEHLQSGTEEGVLPDVTVDVSSAVTDTKTAPGELPPELREHPRYEIRELIGHGGMGDVYQAQHKLMNRVVALKVIKPELMRNDAVVDRFRREVQAAAKLRHANIVTAHDAEQAGGLHYLVMEYVDGENLAEAVSQRGRLPVKDACDYIRQAAEGLQHAHDLGMVHRDIKPHNLMIEQQTGTIMGSTTVVKILDFGLANFANEVAAEELGIAGSRDEPEQQSGEKIAPGASIMQRLTQTGTMMGTADYITPEQARNAQAADIRADIYSLGCTFFTLLVGRAPFGKGSVLERLKAHGEQEAPPISDVRDDVPAELAAIVSKMMAKDPDDRFQTPAEVAAALSPFTVDSREASSVAGVHVLQHNSPGHVQQPDVISLPEMPGASSKRSTRPFFKSLKGAVTMLTLASAVVLLAILAIQPGVTPRPQDSKERNARDSVPTIAYKATPATQKMLDDLVKQIKSKESPWGNSIAEKQNFWNGELRSSAERIRERLGMIQAGKVKNTKQTVNELRGLTQRLQTIAQPNESSYTAAGKLAAMSWPLLLAGYAEDFNEAMVELTVPYPAIRVGDKMAEADRPTEPLGWDVQAAHALALARAGKTEEALWENQALLKKIDVNVRKGRLPEVQLEFLGTTRSQKSLWKQTLLQKSLILAIAGRIAESVDASTAAGRIEVNNPAQDDQSAIQAMLGVLARAMAPRDSGATNAEAGPEKDLTADEFIRRLTAKHGHLVPKLQKMLSAAAGIPNAQWQKFAADPNGATDAIQGEPLSLVLWKLKPLEASTKNLMVLGDFQYIGGVPKPKQLPDAMFPSQVNGYYSMIQPHYISGLTIDLKQDAKHLKGSFHFQAPNLYAGKVDYVVQIEGDDLRVVEFTFPNYGIRLVRGEDGLWGREDVTAPVASPAGGRQSSEHAKAATTINALRQILDVFKTSNGSYPTTAAGWDAAKPFLKQIPVDPWGNPFGYEFPPTRGGDATKPDIWSWGADGKNNTNDDITNWQITTTSSEPQAATPREILDQTYTILDSGTSIGKRHLFVTEKAQRLCIDEETLLAMGLPRAAGIVERDTSIDYSLSGGMPQALRGEFSVKEAGEPVTKGAFEFISGEAVMAWTSYSESGHTLEMPKQQSAIVKPPVGAIVFESTIPVVGPRLLLDDGQRRIVWAKFDNTPNETLVEFKTGYRLERTGRPENAGFTIALFKPESSNPEMALDFDAEGKCERIQAGRTIVMQPQQMPLPKSRKQRELFQLDTGRPFKEVESAFDRYFKEKHPLYAELSDRPGLEELVRSEAERRKLAERAEACPVAKIINSFPGKPPLTFVEKSELSKDEISLVEMDLYRNEDGTCRVVVREERQKKQEGVPFEKSKPISEEDIRNMIK